jgi:hypothetical protein
MKRVGWIRGVEVRAASSDCRASVRWAMLAPAPPVRGD